MSQVLQDTDFALLIPNHASSVRGEVSPLVCIGAHERNSWSRCVIVLFKERFSRNAPRGKEVPRRITENFLRTCETVALAFERYTIDLSMKHNRKLALDPAH